ncbi:flagellar biosynthesis protein FlgN [Treponema zioleckii]|uniref:flagellar biosynthesis protein FlgN n=1 Tax=Treponema zioleckii TaxID=331680 RepID=UPI00168BA2CE|nr:flagellar biosynthesis protein FlgN [Treponema zioleckii]
MAIKLSQQELEERVAIVKRFKSLLEEQREKFREYLIVLESQQERIEQEDGDSLQAHAELGNQIVENIASLQKVIVPMQDLYLKKVGENSEDAISKIQEDLASMHKQVMAQNEKNRTLLQAHMNQIQMQIGKMARKNPYYGKRSVYAERAAVGTVLSLEG